MDFLDAIFKTQIWPAEDMNEVCVWVIIFTVTVFAATALLRIWWLLSTFTLRRRKLQLEVERAEQQNKEAELAEVRRSTSRRSNGRGEQTTPGHSQAAH